MNKTKQINFKTVENIKILKKIDGQFRLNSTKKREGSEK